MDDISGPSSAFGASYLYRPNGDVDRATFHPSGQSLFTYDYGYDGLQRLTSADFGPNGLTGAYDLEQVSYDANGNITALKRRKDTGARVDHLSYSYAFGTNRLNSITDNAGAQHDWDAGSGTFGYDANGNLTSTTAAPYSLSSVTYDERNLPTSITTGGTTTTYRYSEDGQRTYKKEGSNAPEYYVLDGSTTLAVVTGTSVDYWNVTLPSGEVIGRHLNSGGRRYYLKDHLGSVRVVVDGSGTVKETRDYYPFGLPMPGRITAEATSAKEDFTGHEKDAETQLHYAGARSYMSAFGRWTTTDPLLEGNPNQLLEDGKSRYLSVTPYNYVFNNPTGMTDPTGLAACPPDCGFQSVVGGFWNYTANRIKTAFNDAEHAATHPKETLDAAIQEQREGNFKDFNEDATRLADGVSDLSTGAAVVGLAGAPFTGGGSLSLTGYALTAGSVADATSLGLKTYDAATGDGSTEAVARQAVKVGANFAAGKIATSILGKTVVRTGSGVTGPVFRSPATGRFVTNKFGYSVEAAADATRIGVILLKPEERIVPPER